MHEFGYTWNGRYKTLPTQPLAFPHFVHISTLLVADVYTPIRASPTFPIPIYTVTDSTSTETAILFLVPRSIPTYPSGMYPPCPLRNAIEDEKDNRRWVVGTVLSRSL